MTADHGAHSRRGACRRDPGGDQTETPETMQPTRHALLPLGPDASAPAAPCGVNKVLRAATLASRARYQQAVHVL